MGFAVAVSVDIYTSTFVAGRLMARFSSLTARGRNCRGGRPPGGGRRCLSRRSLSSCCGTAVAVGRLACGNAFAGLRSLGLRLCELFGQSLARGAAGLLGLLAFARLRACLAKLVAAMLSFLHLLRLKCALHFAKHAVQHFEGFHRSPGSAAFAACCCFRAAALAFCAAAGPLGAFVSVPAASLTQRMHN